MIMEYDGALYLMCMLNNVDILNVLSEEESGLHVEQRGLGAWSSN